MAAKVTQTNVLGGLGQRVAKAYAQHKGDDTKMGGFQDLPAGIKRGIAKLVSAELGVFKSGDDAGKPYVMISGVMQEPEVFEGQKLRGQRASKTFPICDQTKKMEAAKSYENGPIGKWGHHIGSFDENYAEFMNELRKFGINTATAPLNSEEGIRSVLTAMANSKPPLHFFVSTEGWENKVSKKSGVSVYFNGLAQYELRPAGANGFTASDEPAAEETADVNTNNDDTDGDGIDWLALAKEADATGDMSAIEQLKDKAREVGIDEKVIDDIPKWGPNDDGEENLYDMIQAKLNGDTAANEPEPEAFEPKVGVICNYTIKPGGKTHQVKIDKIDKKNQTADLTNATDKRTKYAAVPFAKLSAA